MSGRGRGGWGGGRGFIRFQSSSSGGGGHAAIPPPPALQTNSQPSSAKGFSALSMIKKVDPISSSLKLRHKTEDSYFDDDEEEAPMYLPGPGSPGPGGPGGGPGQGSDDEDDPLDAFMSVSFKLNNLL